MLKYIKIKNFLSFNEETEINFESNNYGNLKGNVFGVGKNVLMKSCIIYGANASGKTNILRAINFIKNIALFSHETNFNANITPFLLNSNGSNSPSFFEICFFIDNIEYIYNFEILKDKIISENLYEIRKSKPEIIFTRNNLEIIPGKGFEKELEKGKDKVRENSSVIAVLSQWNGKLGDKPINYFFNKINIIIGDFPMPFSAELLEIQNNPEKKEFVIEFLKSADINIEDIKITKENLPPEFFEIFKNSPKNIIDNYSTKIEFGHKNYETGEIVNFNLNNESDGTQKLFKILGPVISTILNEGILFVDEIETNLHLHILQNLLKLIHAIKLDKKYQFIFTTHNLDLMDLSYFKKEQIVLTKKDKSGNTILETLYDYNIRSENDIKKMYNNGAFGAIPNLKDFSILLNNFKVGAEKND